MSKTRDCVLLTRNIVVKMMNSAGVSGPCMKIRERFDAGELLFWLKMMNFAFKY